MEIKKLLSILNESYDEILIYDNNYNLLYVNKACERHYGISQKELMSMSFQVAVDEFKAWSNPILPLVYKYKKPIRQNQQTYLGFNTLLIANPVFNDLGELTHVIMISRDCCNEIDVLSASDIDPALGESCNIVEEEESFEGLNNISVKDLIQKMVAVSVPCILLGESGTGKTFLAKYIHKHSERADKPFVVQSCPSIPNSLFESELFGHAKGAFSGATGAREGLFAQAEGGTLLLDEISELPLEMQAKLLHVIQEKEYRPVGSSKSYKTDVRILAATNRDIFSMVEHKLFRQDLFFRLNVLDLTLPPLRERREELPDLIDYYLRQFRKKYEISVEICDSTLKLMRAYQWPGNIRELKNVIERMVIMADGYYLEPRHLPPSFFSMGEVSVANKDELSSQSVLQNQELSLEELRSLYLVHNSSRKLAKAIGVSQSTANRLINRYIKMDT